MGGGGVRVVTMAGGVRDLEPDTCTREFGGDVAQRWKSDADQNALINIPCFVESMMTLPDAL